MSLSTLLQKANIPLFDPRAAAVVRFSTTRNEGDGALRSAVLQRLRAAFTVQTFVETGTYLGQTTQAAAGLFEEVHTIELSPELCSRARERFAAWGKVSVYQGDSAECLSDVLRPIRGRILLYLDGHYSGGVTARGTLNTPVLQELAAVARTGKSDAVILIDDIRLFQPSRFPEKIKPYFVDDYPDLRELVAAILEVNPRYQICFLGDALLAFPDEPSVTVSPVASACAVHRLATICGDLDERDLENADHAIAAAQADERQEIADYYRVYAPFEIEHGYRSFAALWYGLVLRAEGHHWRARAVFRQAARNSTPGWRVQRFVR